MQSWREGLLGFTVAVAYWPGLLSGAFAPRWALVAVLVPLLCRITPSALPELCRLLLACVLAAAGISILQAPDHLGGLYDYFHLMILGVCVVAGAGLVRLDGLFAGLGAGLALSSAIVLAQVSGWSGVTNLSGTPSGLFFNAEVLGTFAALVLVWGAVRRVWWIAAVAFIPVALCESRLAILASLVGLAYGFLPRRALIAVGLLVPLAGLCAILLLGDYKLGTAFHRATIWGASLHALTWTGQGLGWYATAFPALRYAHSDALQMLVEFGIPALFLLYIPYVILRERMGDVAGRAALVAGGVEILMGFPLHMPATGFVIAVVAGHLLGRGYAVRCADAVGRVEDHTGVQRQTHAGGLAALAGRLRASAVSVRSVFARRRGECAAETAGG
jgi:hypothetical protein